MQSRRAEELTGTLRGAHYQRSSEMLDAVLLFAIGFALYQCARHAGISDRAIVITGLCLFGAIYLIN